jgi:phage shock protein C
MTAMNNNRLFRNTDSKVIGGVASGLADYLHIDVVFIRVLLVMGFFIPAPIPIVFIYIIFWIVMPKANPRIKSHAAKSFCWLVPGAGSGDNPKLQILIRTYRYLQTARKQFPAVCCFVYNC